MRAWSASGIRRVPGGSLSKIERYDLLRVALSCHPFLELAQNRPAGGLRALLPADRASRPSASEPGRQYAAARWRRHPGEVQFPRDGLRLREARGDDPDARRRQAVHRNRRAQGSEERAHPADSHAVQRGQDGRGAPPARTCSPPCPRATTCSSRAATFASSRTCAASTARRAIT